MKNKDKAQRAAGALSGYHGRDAGDTLADNIVDLITDLLHLAHQKDIMPDYVIGRSQQCFAEEAGPWRK